MARRYVLSRPLRAINAVGRVALRLGVAPPGTYLLEVRGRRSGQLRTTPVSIVQDAEGRWLVAPYGPVQWVRNARAAGEVTLVRGRRRERLRVEEVHGEQAARVLRQYVRKVRIVRPYFDVRPDDPPAAFVAEAPRHPVFRLRPPA